MPTSPETLRAHCAPLRTGPELVEANVRIWSARQEQLRAADASAPRGCNGNCLQGRACDCVPPPEPAPEPAPEPPKPHMTDFDVLIVLICVAMSLVFAAAWVVPLFRWLAALL